MHHDTASLRSSLVEFCLDRIARHEDFAKAETSALEDMLAELASAMSEALERFDTQLLAEKPDEWRVKDRRSRAILTEFGEVTFSRRVYIDEFEDRRTYLDEILSLRPRKRLSPGAFQALALFGAEIPYARAVKTLFRHCPQAVSAMTAMGTLREVGDLLERPTRSAWRPMGSGSHSNMRRTAQPRSRRSVLTRANKTASAWAARITP